MARSKDHTVRIRRNSYQLPTYIDDVDLNKKPATWEDFYNFSRPHGAHRGLPPYEALKSMLG
jgi:hypothetical protein